MQSTYAIWIGQPVILQLAAADIRVPLRGMIVGGIQTTLFAFRVEQTWDIDIYKSMILAVEAGPLGADSGQLHQLAFNARLAGTRLCRTLSLRKNLCRPL